MGKIGVGIVGYGNVGRSTAQILRSRSESISRRVGAELAVTAVCRRSAGIEPPSGARATNDWRQVVNAPEVDIVVETMGGTEAACEVVRAALSQGKPVVTANKNLLATHGDELFALAGSRNLPLGFEATVAGGVPVLRAITDGAAGDELEAVYGILNGTCNYILTRMDRGPVGFDEALAEAQRQGYAEAEPSMDIDGIDARDKLAILARLVFGRYVSAERVTVTGIRQIRAVDVQYAGRLHRCIRLIASAELNEGALEVSVAPWLVGMGSMLAKVEGVNNAVFLVGQSLGTQMFYGCGAGGEATGAAVVGDVIEIGRALTHRHLKQRVLPGFQREHELPLCATPRPCSWYLRLTVRDRPGIIAAVASAIAKRDINIDSVIQEPGMREELSFVVTVHPTSEPVIREAVREINGLDFMLEPVLLLKLADGPLNA